MNKKTLIIATAMLTLVMAVTGCKSSKEQKETEGSTTGTNEIVASLTSEQRTYLAEEEMLSDYALSEMSKEAINWYLLGTGLELYNTTSGVEKNGVVYDADSDYDYTAQSESDKIMTMEDVKAFRDKDVDMRVEDLAGYSYTIEKKYGDTPVYTINAPIDGYDNTGMKVMFTIEDGKINMRVPYINYDCDDGTSYTFSIKYDEADAKAFFEDYSLENKVIVDVVYTTVTDESLMLYVKNYTEDEVKFDGAYKIFLVDDNGDDIKEVMSGNTEAYEIDAKNMSAIPVNFEEKLDKGTYRIEYGDYSVPFENI